MRVITASYNVYADFKIPKSIPLLSIKDNDKVKADAVPWSWWVKWSVLHYYNAEGKEQTIEPEDDFGKDYLKRPVKTMEEDDGEEEEEEEEE